MLVDDGGLDRTTPRAIELAHAAPHPTTVIRLARNFGQHAAVFAGLAHARGDAVATLDSDLQYPPEEIPAMLRELSASYPVVSGYRESRRDPFLRRSITRLLTRWLNRKTGVKAARLRFDVPRLRPRHGRSDAHVHRAAPLRPRDRRVARRADQGVRSPTSRAASAARTTGSARWWRWRSTS